MRPNDIDPGTADDTPPSTTQVSETHMSSELSNKEEAMAATGEGVGVASGQDPEKPNASFQPTARFWAIMATLCVVGLLAAFENTVVAIALPVISEDLGLGENYVWVTNVFFLTR